MPFCESNKVTLALRIGTTNSMKKRVFWLLALLATASFTTILLSSILISTKANGRVYDSVVDVPFNEVGLLLGCSEKLSDGSPNQFFLNRIRAAAELFKNNKINHIIVSGDNSRPGYDEPTDMKNALMAAGIPAERIYSDFAGFRTLDSVVRAKTIFGRDKITVISQRFHNERAIFIASHHGIEAIGYSAKEVSAFNSFKTKLRELLAKVLTVLDLFIFQTQPKYAGSAIQIQGANTISS